MKSTKNVTKDMSTAEIEMLAKRGEQCDVMKALTLLTKAYIAMCGISLGCRTVIYCAGEPWLERLAWMDLPLSEMARKEPFVMVMPHVTTDYDPKEYDKYDITGMSDEEILNACQQIVRLKEFDEPTLEVLCWGVMKSTEEQMKLSKELEATAPDGTKLKGVLTKQKCCRTSVTMTAPYDLAVAKSELVRQPEELLADAYLDYHRLRGMEDEIRALYPIYKEKLKECGGSHWKKYCAFRYVFGPVMEGTVLVDIKRLFNEWFGLQFDEND